LNDELFLGKAMRVLLAEDESKVSSFVSRGLVAKRFAMDVAAERAIVLELATTHDYDLIILDLMLRNLRAERRFSARFELRALIASPDPDGTRHRGGEGGSPGSGSQRLSYEAVRIFRIGRLSME
jgi:hypothetical protein